MLALLPVLMPESYWITRLSEYMRYAILAIGWVLFSGPTGYMSLATAAFYGLGFYMAAILNGPLPFAGGHHLGRHRRLHRRRAPSGP